MNFMAKDHETYLKNLFCDEYVVFTASELIQKICENFNTCTKANARKIIQNSVIKGIIKSTKPITFGHRQYAYYGQQFDIKPELLKDIIKENRPGLHRIIKRMDENKGVISYLEAFKISGCLTQNTTSKVNTLSQLVKILEELKLAKTKCEYNSGTSYLVKYNMSESEALIKIKENICKLQLDCMFIPSFLIWLQKHDLISNKNIIYRNKNKAGDGAILNNLIWDAVCYTNTTGFFEYIGDYTNEKKTIVVLDFKISNKYTIDDLYGFYDRIQIYRNSVKNKDNKRKILPIIVINETTKEVNSEIKKLRILSFNLGTVFGERMYEIIQELEIISFNNLADGDMDFTGRIERILSVLRESGQEENLGNLKGELFERLIDKVIRTIYAGNINELKHGIVLNRTNQETKKREGYEYDYLLETKDEYIVFELKGYKGTSFIKKGQYNKETKKPEKNTVKWFFALTYPFAKKIILEKMNLFPKNARTCYITTARFDNEALKVLDEKNKTKDKPKDLDVYYDGKKLLNLLKDHELEKEIKVINQYYKPFVEEIDETKNINDDLQQISSIKEM